MIRDQFRRFKHAQRQKRAIAEIASRPIISGAAHGLPGPLIVSLTSYPARFDTLALTIKALLRQSVQPDKVILWLARGDENDLPEDVVALKSAGLEVATCPDWRSYKKIIPALSHYPDSYIVTADDDLYYERDWLAELVRAVKSRPGVVGWRAHRIACDSRDIPVSYHLWEKNISGQEQAPDVFLTGGMGSIYPPGLLHPDACNPDIFLKLCPSADDVWLYWMHRLVGACAAKTGRRLRIVEWHGSQASNLRTTNLGGGGNDRAIQAMLGRYGWPA